MLYVRWWKWPGAGDSQLPAGAVSEGRGEGCSCWRLPCRAPGLSLHLCWGTTQHPRLRRNNQPRVLNKADLLWIFSKPTWSNTFSSQPVTYCHLVMHLVSRCTRYPFWHYCQIDWDSQQVLWPLSPTHWGFPLTALAAPYVSGTMSTLLWLSLGHATSSVQVI